MELKKELLLELEYVSFDEGFVLHAHDLLCRSQMEMLREEDWDRLCSLVWRLRLQLPREPVRLRERLLQLTNGGAIPAEVEALEQELMHRIARALSHMNSKDMGWDNTVRQVRATLPIAPPNRVSLTTDVAVHSRIVPGTALGSWFEERYTSDDGTGRTSAKRYTHVPQLAQTILINEAGQPLFSGLRHGIVNASELGGDLLQRLGDEELQSLVGEFVIGEAGPDAAGQAHGQQVSARCDSIRNNVFLAASDAYTIRQAACMQMAKQSVAAALVGDSRTLGRALVGETIDLRLFSISLLKQEDFASWSEQQQAFAELDQQGVMQIRVRHPDVPAVFYTVVANLKIRQFVLSAGEEVLNPWARQVGNDEIERLLGPPHESELQGDINTDIAVKQAQVARLAERCTGLQERYDRSVGEGSGDRSADSLRLEGKILLLDEKRALLEKRIRTLSDAGAQLKAMWVQEPGLPSGREPHRKAAARLALIGRLMGEMPVLICKTGRDFARQLDPEIKFLATVADKLHGCLPLVEENMDTWGPAREAFTPQ